MVSGIIIIAKLINEELSNLGRSFPKIESDLGYSVAREERGMRPSPRRSVMYFGNKNSSLLSEDNGGCSACNIYQTITLRGLYTSTSDFAIW